jgi:hypothetical protein
MNAVHDRTFRLNDPSAAANCGVLVFPKHPRPVVPEGAFMAVATLDAAAGATAIRRAVTDGFLKPSDIADAELGVATLLYVPFWRVAVSVDGFHIGLTSFESNRTGKTMTLPTGGARHKDAVVSICARTVVPYEAKLPSIFGPMAGAPPLEIGMNELVSVANAARELDAAEVVEADVDRSRAEYLASSMVLRAVRPNNALYAKYEPRILSTTFCFYPLYWARYRYDGEARRHPGEECFVAVSARTGNVIMSKHPSAMRAGLTKLRKFLSFDRR